MKVFSLRRLSFLTDGIKYFIIKEISKELINMTKHILIAMPCYGGQMSELTGVGLFKTAQQLSRQDIRVSLLTVGNESMICRARSKIFNYFYHRTDADKIIFIDADIQFVPDDILKLLELDVDFCAAGVPLKSTTPTYNFGVVVDEHGNLKWNSNKTAFEVDFVGTAFMMLDRRVHDVMSPCYPELRYRPDTTGRYTNAPATTEHEVYNSFHFFQTYIDQTTGDFRSEDYAFCDRWTKLGEKIFLRPDIQLNHVGSNVFTGINLEEQFNKLK
jgi:hypothetical protein